MKNGSKNWGSNLSSRSEADRSQTYFSITKQALLRLFFFFGSLLQEFFEVQRDRLPLP
ncbi:UNVERIFIED_CONTAM: hypothetical protein ABIC26_004120 [Paenibacillus sp. PvR008]